MYLITYWVLLEFPTQAQVQVAYAQFTHETFNYCHITARVKMCRHENAPRGTEQCVHDCLMTPIKSDEGLCALNTMVFNHRISGLLLRNKQAINSS